MLLIRRACGKKEKWRGERCDLPSKSQPGYLETLHLGFLVVAAGVIWFLGAC